MQKLFEVCYVKQFEKQSAKIPRQLQKAIASWINSIEYQGLYEVRKSIGYHDEPLQGKRFGQRSVKLNRDYRLIYKEDKKEKTVLLLEVTKHEY